RRGWRSVGRFYRGLPVGVPGLHRARRHRAAAGADAARPDAALGARGRARTGGRLTVEIQPERRRSSLSSHRSIDTWVLGVFVGSIALNAWSSARMLSAVSKS